MNHAKLFDPQSLYAIPWSAANNANGWIEPTTHCQLKCPGCYRGLGREDHRPVHMALDELKGQVDILAQRRNVQTISIAGGEPLLYPHLDGLVAYIRGKGIKTVVLTNGLLLDEERLVHLRDMGVDCFLLHLDKEQGRTPSRDEAAVNRLRAGFCDLFRRVGGVQLGFIMPVSPDTLADMEVLAPFFQANADVIGIVIFTMHRHGLLESAPNRDGQGAGIAPILAEIKSAFKLSYCAYIPKLHSSDPGWLYASTLYRGGKPWKQVTPQMFEAIQNAHYRARGRYQYASFKKRSPRLIDQGIYSQTLMVVNVPVKTDQGWDLCKGCPDAMVYQGRLVPSCLLERIKQGQDIRVFGEEDVWRNREGEK